MTRLWTYVMAGVSLALIAALVVIGVYVPGLQRDLERERQMAAWLSVATARITPEISEEYQLSAEFVTEPGTADTYAGQQQYQGKMILNVTANPEAQLELAGAMLSRLDESVAEGDGQGSLVDGQQRYIVMMSHSDLRLQATILLLTDNQDQ